MCPDGLSHSRFSHVDLVASSLDRGLAFYRGLRGPLGWTRHSRHGGVVP